jgi:proline iminopeptidase
MSSGEPPAPPSHAWQVMYPPRACYDQGWMDVGDGHEIYWEECGHPLGQPALFIHGGPGAGCTPDDRRWFDPARYRIVLFDQRGAGRSRPLGSTEHNTTAHLLRDMEALRQHLHIERWLLFGGSWGATLALAYAQQHPDHTAALVLRGVFLASPAEQAALYGPQREAWMRALCASLHGDDTAAAQRAAHDWWGLEHELMAGDDNAAPARPASAAPPTAAQSPTDAAGITTIRITTIRIASARIGVHYARHSFFVDGTPLLHHAHRLHGLRGVIVQGERDRVTPPATARALHRAWPGSRLCLLAHAGHASQHPAVAQQLIAATDFFADTASAQAHAHPPSQPGVAPWTSPTPAPARPPAAVS